MDKAEVIKLAQQYKVLLAEYLPLKDVYLYGSYSKGTQSKDSDIDIAIIVDSMTADYFQDTSLVWKLRRKISTRIEPVLLLTDSDNPLFYDIQQYGIRI